MLGWALSCSALALEGKGVGEGLCGGNTSRIPSIGRCLPITGQNCVRVCPGSFCVSSNNTALGSPGSSVALAINHPLTVRSCKGGNRSHVAAVPPPHGRRGRGASSALGPPKPTAGHELRVLNPRPLGRGVWGRRRVGRHSRLCHGAAKLPGNNPAGRRLLGKALKHVAFPAFSSPPPASRSMSP